MVQEAALAKESRIILGKTELDWIDFILTCTWQMLRFPVRQNWIDRISKHFALYTYYNPSVLQAFGKGQIKESHLYMLAGAQGLQFSDARDRIFTFAELAKDFPGYIPVQPNYEISSLLAYKTFAVDYVRHNRSVEVLEYAGHTAESLEDNLPSWVPRWYDPPELKKKDHERRVIFPL